MHTAQYSSTVEPQHTTYEVFATKNIKHKSSQIPCQWQNTSLTICVCFCAARYSKLTCFPLYPKLKRTDPNHRLNVLVHCAPCQPQLRLPCYTGVVIPRWHKPFSWRCIGGESPPPPEPLATPRGGKEKRDSNLWCFVRASSRHASIVTPDIVTHGAMW